MKNKRKAKPAPKRVADSTRFGAKKVRADDYHALRLRNDQGEREEVVLLDLQGEGTERALLVREDQPELRYDLTKALGMFTVQERRVLMRVLLYRQSVSYATRYMKKRSTRTWRRWMKERALPKLRRVLRDYKVDGKVVVS